MNLCDIKEIRRISELFNIKPRKEYGQNFLTDKFIVEDIAQNCCDKNTRTILEIGPGIGSLTQELALLYDKVVSLEIDTALIPVLSYTLSGHNNIEIINCDVMKADLDSLLNPYFQSGAVSVCANLPYYITTPILMRLIESGLPFDYITVMIQSEVADRICAKAGHSDYGAITAVIAYYGNAEKLFTVGSENFSPQPKVNSTVIRIKLYKEKPIVPKSEKLLFRVIKSAFEQRRKTLLNALSHGFPEIDKSKIAEQIERCGFAPDIRGEKLDISQFAKLSDAIYEISK